VAMLAPTYGLSDMPNYRGWFPGDANRNLSTSMLGPGAKGDRLLLTGRILTKSGEPMSNVRLEFWQADADGVYALAQIKFIAVQRSSADGGYTLETVVPGYAGRIRNINCLATVTPPPGHSQPIMLCVPIHFATDEELDAPVSAADRPYVRPGARRPWDDASFLRISALPLENGVRQARYDIVFDLA